MHTVVMSAQSYYLLVIRHNMCVGLSCVVFLYCVIDKVSPILIVADEYVDCVID